MIAALIENPYSFIVWISTVVGVSSLLHAVFSDKRSNRIKLQSDYVAQLESRLEAMERQIKDEEARLQKCEAKTEELKNDNINLMRKLLAQ
jgi:TolA-binding protein